jgi:DNA replication protein DnaC
MSTTAELAHLTRALKAPRIRRAAIPLAERARAEGWAYERYLAAVLEEEVLAREASGGALRVRAARLPAIKTLDDFDFSFQRSLRKQVIVHLAQLDFLLEAKNVVFLGVPGPARDRQDPPVDRPGCPGRPSRSPGRLRHRPPVGGPPGRRPTRRPAGC